MDLTDAPQFAPAGKRPSGTHSAKLPSEAQGPALLQPACVHSPWCSGQPKSRGPFTSKNAWACLRGVIHQAHKNSDKCLFPQRTNSFLGVSLQQLSLCFLYPSPVSHTLNSQSLPTLTLASVLSSPFSRSDSCAVYLLRFPSSALCLPLLLTEPLDLPGFPLGWAFGGSGRGCNSPSCHKWVLLPQSSCLAIRKLLHKHKNEAGKLVYHVRHLPAPPTTSLNYFLNLPVYFANI